MKIQILVRSADWLNSAGTRIRYVRLTRELNALGWTLAIDPISRVSDGLRLNADIYLFSKCQDAATLMLADMLREAGALVGFDLFDDYFSGQENATFAHRVFQHALIGRVDFLLCSTDRMAAIARNSDPQARVHVMNDPHDPIARATVSSSIRERLEHARESCSIDAVWFGHGNNPAFPVGLHDVIAFGRELQAFHQAGWQVRLKILTNSDAIDQAVLGPLQSLPAKVQVEEWSESGEAIALDRALLAFLPVNFQSFSIAKSLNRAVSALARGAQVLSPGFPLYEPLRPFIYQSCKDLADDLARGTLKLNEGSLDELAERLAKIADPKQEAVKLVHFFAGLVPRPAPRAEDRAMRGIIHGTSSPSSTHRLCKSLGWLSLGSLYSRHRQPFHAEIAQFEPDGCVELRVSREGYARLADSWRESAQPLARSADGYSYLVPLPDNSAGRELANAKPEMWKTRAARILTFSSLMHATQEVYREVFPQTHLLVSEHEMPLTAADLQMENG